MPESRGFIFFVFNQHIEPVHQENWKSPRLLSHRLWIPACAGMTHETAPTVVGTGRDLSLRHLFNSPRSRGAWWRTSDAYRRARRIRFPPIACPAGYSGWRQGHGKRASTRDVLASVDPDQIARHPLRAGGGQRRDGVGYFLRRRQLPVRIDFFRSLDHLGVPGNLAKGGRVRDAGLDAVRRNALGREFDRELANMALERGLGRRHGAVSLPDAVSARARHGVDAAPEAHEAAAHERLGPIDEAVRHDVQRHFELPGGDGVFLRIGDVGLQRAEGQAVEQDAHRALGVHAQVLLYLIQNALALFMARRVHVVIKRLCAVVPDLFSNALHVGQRGFPVEVNP